MFSISSLIINRLIEEIQMEYERMYGTWNIEYGNIAGWTARLALENISNSDMLYHNVDHTVMVSMAGLQIIRGKHLSEGGVSPHDWLHFIVALVCHDVGYVHGICRYDTDATFYTGVGEQNEPYDRKGTDAALTPYHVDRGKCFIHERFADHEIIDEDTVASLIEMTRFPVPDDEAHSKTDSYAGLLRAADLIGQLGDPDYLRKIPALFYEFDEIGTNEKIGYENPGDLRVGFAKFYWGVIYPYVKDGLRFLRVTQEGKQWIANLHSHVFSVEHDDV